MFAFCNLSDAIRRLENLLMSSWVFFFLMYCYNADQTRLSFQGTEFKCLFRNSHVQKIKQRYTPEERRAAGNSKHLTLIRKSSDLVIKNLNPLLPEKEVDKVVSFAEGVSVYEALLNEK